MFRFLKYPSFQINSTSLGFTSTRYVQYIHYIFSYDLINLTLHYFYFYFFFDNRIFVKTNIQLLMHTVK